MEREEGSLDGTQLTKEEEEIKKLLDRHGIFSKPTRKVVGTTDRSREGEANGAEKLAETEPSPRSVAEEVRGKQENPSCEYDPTQCGLEPTVKQALERVIRRRGSICPDYNNLESKVNGAPSL